MGKKFLGGGGCASGVARERPWHYFLVEGVAVEILLRAGFGCWVSWLLALDEDSNESSAMTELVCVHSLLEGIAGVSMSLCSMRVIVLGWQWLLGSGGAAYGHHRAAISLGAAFWSGWFMAVCMAAL